MAYRSKLRSCDEVNLLGKVYDGDSSSSSDSEMIFYEHESDEKSACSYNMDSSVSGKDCKVKRLSRRNPTRRPDPNVSNRNAVLARENRRRKKEHLEKLENDIKSCQSNNKRLSKIMKKQSKIINKLQYERNYYRNILVNKKTLFGLIDVIRNSKTIFGDDTTKLINTTTDTINHPIPINGDIGSALTEDPFLSSALMEKCNNIFTDYKSYNDDDDDEQWNLLGNISPFTMERENMDSSGTSDLGFDSNSTLPDTLIERK